MRLRLVAAVTLVVGLGVGLGGAAAAAGAAPPPAGSAPATADRTDAGRCARLGDRIAEVPGIRARIRQGLGDIADRLAAVRPDAARARLRERLQPRIDALAALDARLAEQVARVEERCPGVT